MAQSLRSFSFPWCSTFWSVRHQAEALVTSPCCYFYDCACIQGKQQKDGEREKAMGVCPTFLGGYSSTIQSEKFPSLTVLASIAAIVASTITTTGLLGFWSTREQKEEKTPRDFYTFSEHLGFPSTSMRQTTGLLLEVSLFGSQCPLPGVRLHCIQVKGYWN